MNLTNDPWIPVIYRDGTHSLVSLRQIFSEGENISDIEVRPQDRISLMRLFLCIAQGAAKDWPETMEAYQKINIDEYRQKAIQYLEERTHLFNLFDPKKPFLQISDLENFSNKEIFTPLSKLDLCLATGNNPTVFDNLALDPDRHFSPATIALNLLTFQCMSPPGLSSQVKWKGQGTPKSTQGSPLLKVWHVYTQRENILKTIYSNGIPKKDMEVYRDKKKFKWGVPVWDRFPTSSEDTEAWDNAKDTYLGRLVFLSALIKIDEKKNRMIWGKPFTQKGHLTITSDFPDPSIPRRRDKRPLLIDLTKGSWRDLPSILEWESLLTRTVVIEMDKKIGKFCLWAGGLKNGDIGKSAKVEGSIESYFYLPHEIFNVDGPNIYSQGVDMADKICGHLRRAVKKYLITIYSNPKEGSSKKSEAEVEKRAQNTAFLFYEQAQARLDLLFNHVETFNEENSKNPLWIEYLKKIHKNLFFTTCRIMFSRAGKAYARAFELLYQDKDTHKNFYRGKTQMEKKKKIFLNNLLKLAASSDDPKSLKRRNYCYAKLKRGLCSRTRWYAYEVIQWCQGDIYSLEDITLGGLFATHDKNITHGGNVGALWAQIVKKRREELDKSSSLFHFNRLLDCKDSKELCNRLIPLIHYAKAESISVDYQKLYEDLTQFSKHREEIIRNWSQGYWSYKND